MAAQRLCVVTMSLLLGVAILRAQDADRVKITVAKANLRSEPNEKSTVLTQAVLGATFEMRGAEGDWYRVIVNKGDMRAVAYVSMKVAKLEPATSTPPVPVTPPPVSTAGAPVADPAPSAPFAEGISVVLQTTAGTSWLTPHAVRATASSAATGGAIVNWTWTVDGETAAPGLADRRPRFVILYREIPAMSADDVSPVLVRLAPSGPSARLVAAARGRADAATRRDADWDLEKELKQDVVRVEIAPSERGSARLRPVADLTPGEYAIVVRPVAKKRLAGETVLSQTAEGRLFGVVFDFTIR